jgi:hypothetical protein
MKALRLILSLLITVSSVQAEEERPNAHVVDLPAEVVTLPSTMAGQLALVRETVEVAEMLQTVLEAPDVYVNPQETVCLIGEKWLLPRWRALSELPSERLCELLLLADAIDWQSAWLLDMAEADSCVSMPREAETATCLERLVKAAKAVERQLTNGASPALQEELVRLMEELGGEKLLKRPAQLLEQRWVRDYKTVYSFLAEFKAVLEQGDAAAMAGLRDYTDYLLQSEGDRLRVDALAAVYASVCQAEYKVRPARFRIDAAMQQALQPFLEQLPALRGVLP